MSELRLSLPDEFVDAIADAVAARLGGAGGGVAEPWIGVADAAAHLACKPQRVYDLVHRQAIPHRKDGSRLLFRRSELDAWLADG